ncbi:hypothetical protein GF338_03145 [candidate division WOR-3 bacterium]|nr:hypothetical protein [candidate division WOR-3 bacterium]
MAEGMKHKEMKHKVFYNPEVNSAVLHIVGDFSREDAEKTIESLNKIFRDNPETNLLADFSQSLNASLDKDTRKLIQENGGNLRFNKAALVGVSPMTRMIAKIVLVVIGKINESRFFKTEEEALKWLLGDINK